MNARQRRFYLALKRVEEFLGRTPLDQETPGYAGLVATLKEAIVAVEQHTTRQEIGVQKGTTSRARDRRYTLRKRHLVPLHRIARVLERTMPEMPHLAMLPRPDAPVVSILASARSTAEQLVPYRDVFVEHGAPVDFIERLQSAIADVEVAHSAAIEARQQRAKARGGLNHFLQRGRDAVACIDTIVRRVSAADPVTGPEMLQEWLWAKHVQVSPKRSGETEPLPLDSTGGTPAPTLVTAKAA